MSRASARRAASGATASPADLLENEGFRSPAPHRLSSRVSAQVLALWACAGCAAATFTQTRAYQREPRASEAVEVFRSGGPARPFVEVGQLRVRSSLGYKLGLSKLLDEAGSRGCDAIAQVSAAVAYQHSSGGTSEQTREDDFRASCLVYTDRPHDADAHGEVAPPGERAQPRPFPAGTPD